ncbi:hypothetical protein P0082_00930 [Candidatus Haliotispira prima]|uniref:Chitin-binding type-3 domain-containing protein n=1 Tax=Candidatus Haliotispira prima TaxID=3034016 RepID=A0ABY8MHF5_9SPIO|nr:hypothetical protein P0082_00930 [Candidatus Haliotispira prima]
MGTLYPTHKPGLSLHYGKYTNGIPEAGVPASVVDADHLNLLTDNIEETIKAAGLDPDHATTKVDQLKTALLWAAGIWQAGTDYPAGATVLQGGTRYIATRAHTASGTNAPDQSGAPWASLATETSIAAAIALAKAEAVAGIWQAGTDYPQGATVLQGGTRYIATQTHTASDTNAPDQTGAPWASLATETSIAAAIALAKAEAKSECWPIGSVYINYNSSTNPATLLGFGTWTSLPHNYFLAQAGNRYSAGSIYNDGLPNISGSWEHVNSTWHQKVTGGATINDLSDWGAGGRDWRGRGDTLKLNFNASQSNPIYGSASYVRPKTIGVHMWRRMA